MDSEHQNSLREVNPKRRHTAWAPKAAGVVMAMVVAVVPLVAGAETVAAQESGPKPQRVTVPGNKAFTDSGLKVAKGDSVAVRATGEVQYRGGQPDTAVTAAGVPFGPKCDNRLTPGATLVLPVPGQPCWSLIGRVGDGRPFGIGARKTFTVPRGGRLYFGVNEAAPADNSGAWTATVTITPAAEVPPTTVPAPAPSPPPADASSESSMLPILAIGAGVLVVAALLFLLLKRRRKSDENEPAPDPAEWQRELVAIGAAVSTTAAAAGAAFDPESPDVNIFRVELADAERLEVGYNFFPDGTTVGWRVASRGIPLAVGEFTALGGGSEQHVATLPLGTTVEPDAGAVDISFSWSINEVPFGYSVRRYPVS